MEEYEEIQNDTFAYTGLISRMAKRAVLDEFGLVEKEYNELANKF